MHCMHLRPTTHAACITRGELRAQGRFPGLSSGLQLLDLNMQNRWLVILNDNGLLYK